MDLENTNSIDSVKRRCRTAIMAHVVGIWTVRHYANALTLAAHAIAARYSTARLATLSETVEHARQNFMREGTMAYDDECQLWLECAEKVAQCDFCNGKGTRMVVVGPYDPYNLGNYGITGPMSERKCWECDGSKRRHFHYDWEGRGSNMPLVTLVPNRPDYPAKINRRLIERSEAGIELGTYLNLFPPIDASFWT